MDEAESQEQAITLMIDYDYYLDTRTADQALQGMPAQETYPCR